MIFKYNLTPISTRTLALNLRVNEISNSKGTLEACHVFYKQYPILIRKLRPRKVRPLSQDSTWSGPV